VKTEYGILANAGIAVTCPSREKWCAPVNPATRWHAMCGGWFELGTLSALQDDRASPNVYRPLGGAWAAGLRW